MSLLLDALKKAAEQKAKKSKQEVSPQRTSSETLPTASAADVSAVEDGAEDGAAPLRRNDETQLEHTELKARLDRGERIAGDDTGLDSTDLSDSRRNDDRPAEDLADESRLGYSDATEKQLGKQPDARSASDEPGLSITDLLADRSEQKLPPRQPGDDTGLDIPEQKQAGDERKFSTRRPGDETGLDTADAAESAALDSILEIQSDEDEAIAPGSEEASDFGTDHELDGRPIERDNDTDTTPADDGPTEIKLQVASAEKVDSAGPELPPSAGDLQLVELQDDSVSENDAVVDVDLSLILLDSDQTGRGDNTAFSDPQIPEDRTRVLTNKAASHAEIGLVDTTQSNTHGRVVPGEQTDAQHNEEDNEGKTLTNYERQTLTNHEGQTLSNPAPAAMHPDDTRAATITAPSRNKVTRPADAASTRTDAPDNYDRTLMKLPSDDASNLFAGMKPDADVVMTPDYAKKVFRSKNSAQRAQHYKFYAAIAIILFLSIAIYGGIEYQYESEQIDASMLPLKRDPMPGLNKSRQSQETNLFADTDGQVDARTIEIIQTATEESSRDAVAMIEADTVSGADTGADAPATMAPEPGSETAPTEVATQTQAVATAAETATATSSLAQPKPLLAIPPGDDADTRSKPGAAISTNANSTLQIKTSSAYREVDIWLREAYAAYQAGDTKLAMSRYKELLEVYPDNRNALLGRAAINIQNGNIDAAIVDYRELLLANPKDSLAMSSLLGVVSYSPLQTESQLKLMIRDEPESPYLNFALANSYSAQNRWQEAQGYYFRALQNNPGDPNYAYNLAVSLEHISQPVSARTYYQRALDNFNNGLATFNREVVHQRLEVLGNL